MTYQIQSEQINELASALAKAQGEMKPAIKDAKNPFFKSNYADLSSVWNACQEPLSKNGLSIVQTMDVKEGQNILITTLAHGSGQWMRSFFPIITEKNNAQGIGSAITYMRRYALSAMVGVTCDEDDDGNEACRSQEKKKEAPRTLISRDEAQELEFMLGQCDGAYAQNVRLYYAKKNIPTWAQLPKEEYQKLYDSIFNKLKEKKTELVGV